MNNKGFTLVELLATMALLSVLMIMAVPNVVGVVQRNKNKTYIEDAKKMVSLAEYKVRSGATINPITASRTICMRLSYLGVGNFDKGPNGGTYDPDVSYVKVSKNASNELVYTVTLIENKNANIKEGETGSGTKSYIGIKNKTNEQLYEDDATKYIESINSSYTPECNNSASMTAYSS